MSGLGLRFLPGPLPLRGCTNWSRVCSILEASHATKPLRQLIPAWPPTLGCSVPSCSSSALGPVSTHGMRPSMPSACNAERWSARLRGCSRSAQFHRSGQPVWPCLLLDTRTAIGRNKPDEASTCPAFALPVDLGESALITDPNSAAVLVSGARLVA